MANKLRAVLNGHKGAMTRIYTKFESESLTEDELQSTLAVLNAKQAVVGDIHEKIIESLPEDGTDSIESEIIVQTDLLYSIEEKIQKVKHAIQTCSHSAINVNANSNRENQSSPKVQQNHQYQSQDFHKLPKLELQTFDGKLMEWQEFWDSFESAIHNNQALSNVQKFTYLSSSLRNEPLQTVSGFAFTNANYEKAVDMLQERQNYPIISANIVRLTRAQQQRIQSARILQQIGNSHSRIRRTRPRRIFAWFSTCHRDHEQATCNHTRKLDETACQN